MKILSIIGVILLTLTSFGARSDDAETIPLAKKIKTQIELSLKESREEGYCDLFIEMTHKGSTAIVKRVSSTGDYKLCKTAKQTVRKGQRYRYQTVEKYIRLHIDR
ncbi:hypothetical protein F0231_08410 [Vibrio sp. RE86]|uniref:hypothetical protein n=1 Tax=Vibrio sp. RE86 TaxID=2607605 RepID=UPI0014933BC9|nr:hypothetical protein [Vibrio sp. RE86]NOH79766.1 hypothetical protein [Vibrio sp. RE86]